MCGAYIGSKREGVQSILCDECLRTLPRTEQAQLRENETEMALWGQVRSRAAAKRVMHLNRAAAYLFFEKEHPIQDKG